MTLLNLNFVTLCIQHHASGFTLGVPMDSELYLWIASVFEVRVCASGFPFGLPMDSENLNDWHNHFWDCQRV
jgi:hypothetical protein